MVETTDVLADVGAGTGVGVGAGGGDVGITGMELDSRVEADVVAWTGADAASEGASEGAITDDADLSCAGGRRNSEISMGLGSGMGSLGYNQRTN